jgi:hypothetical protein
VIDQVGRQPVAIGQGGGARGGQVGGRLLHLLLQLRRQAQVQAQPDAGHARPVVFAIHLDQDARQLAA